MAKCQAQTCSKDAATRVKGVDLCYDHAKYKNSIRLKDGSSFNPGTGEKK